MVWNSRTGRPNSFPEDTSDLNGPRIQVTPRIAWLLRTNRLDSPYGRASEFVKRIKALGRPPLPGGPNDVETRGKALPAEVITTYEEVLGLPDGRLLGLADSLIRSFTPGGARHPSLVDEESTWGELARLEGRFQDGCMSGGDWLAFSNLLNQPQGLPLFPSAMEEWVHRLLSEMVRSIGPAYVSRMEAISRLMREKHPREHVVRAIRDAISEPGAQAMIDTVAALGDAPMVSVLDEVLRIFQTSDGGARLGAAFAMEQWAMLGRFSGEQRGRVIRALASVAYDDPVSGGRAALIVAPYLSQRLTVTLRRRAEDAGQPVEQVHRQTRPPALRTYLNAAIDHSGAPGDRMIERLLQEALAPDPGGRRHHAILLISASPYRKPIADAAAGLFEHGSDPVARHAAGHLLSYIADGSHQAALVRLLGHPDLRVQSEALFALAHSSGVPASVDLHDQLIHPDLVPEAIYAAGMSGHPDVKSALESRFVSREVRQSAAWWLRHGARVETV